MLYERLCNTQIPGITHLDCSPDGKFIAFIDEDSKIWMLPVGGGEVYPLENYDISPLTNNDTTIFREGDWNNAIYWSPTGNYLAFSAVLKNQPQYWIVDNFLAAPEREFAEAENSLQPVSFSGKLIPASIKLVQEPDNKRFPLRPPSASAKLALTRAMLIDKSFQFSWTSDDGSGFNGIVTLKEDGSIQGKSSPDETTWIVDDSGYLLFKHHNGKASTRFDKVRIIDGRLCIIGPSLFRKNITQHLIEVDNSPRGFINQMASEESNEIKLTREMLIDKRFQFSWTSDNGSGFNGFATLKEDGSIQGIPSPNETTWLVDESGDLLFKHANGNVSTRYVNVRITDGRLCFIGPFLLRENITHHLIESEESNAIENVNTNTTSDKNINYYQILDSGLQIGSIPFTDRVHKFESISEPIQGLTLLQTAMGHKIKWDDDFSITVFSEKPCVTFLAIDSRVTSDWDIIGKPEWLKDYALTDYTITTDDPVRAYFKFDYEIFYKKCPAGEIQLGPQCPGSTNCSMYFAFFGVEDDT